MLFAVMFRCTGASHEAEYSLSRKTKVFTKPKKRKYSLSRKNESIH